MNKHFLGERHLYHILYVYLQIERVARHRFQIHRAVVFLTKIFFMANQYTPLAYLHKGSLSENPEPKRLAILGATGSIGSQTLDIVSRFPDRYKVVALTANSRVDSLIEASLKHRPDVAVIADARYYNKLKDALEPSGIKCMAGSDALAEVASRNDVDMVVTATVGYSGLLPTIAAIEAGKDIALANKETLVVAGELIRNLMKTSSTRIFPVDSEHSAITQCLLSTSIDDVERLIITASGGPFRTWSNDMIESATAADALRHPNWDMGAKITIDSATMMNKAFEIIEAHYLFGLPADRIDAVVHPQSIVHSMIETRDGAILAQLGVPDMRIPIAFAMAENSRLPDVSPRLSLEKMATLTFEKPDLTKFPCLGFARLALEQGGNRACVINAANEITVRAFLDGKIKFNDFWPIIDEVLNQIPNQTNPSLDDYVASNALARELARESVGRRSV